MAYGNSFVVGKEPYKSFREPRGFFEDLLSPGSIGSRPVVIHP